MYLRFIYLLYHIMIVRYNALLYLTVIRPVFCIGAIVKPNWNKVCKKKRILCGSCCIDQNFAEKGRQTRLLEIRVSKKVLSKKEILPHYQNYLLFLNFQYSEHSLILTKCLVPCMFELTDVCCINVILIIHPSRCFPLKFVQLSSKLWLIKLHTMTSIWLNYINSFWLFRKYMKTCFCMR